MPVNKSVPGSHATKMEISGGALVSFLDTNGNVRPSTDAEMEKF